MSDLAQLEADGLVCKRGDEVRTTRRWQSAMSRAALRLLRQGDAGTDLRVPIAAALVELYGPEHPAEALVRLVELLLPIEARELGPR